MSRELRIIVHRISEDGLPDMRGEYEGGPAVDLTNRVAFLWDGNIVNGWPLDRAGYPGEWETADFGCVGRLGGVTHWIEFPETFTHTEHDGHPPGDPDGTPFWPDLT